jgi:hypothetical protein
MLTNHASMPRSQVWFAHKPLCGPRKADFEVLPAFTPAETRILQSPAFLHTFRQRRVPGRSSVLLGQVMDRLERESQLVPGSIMQVRPSSDLQMQTTSGRG